ncbi:MAG TPA: P1 family peptidase [Alphaproteobacteria bacterium]|nr:P1 family peptidase [Alphaproteobacteria bacterium]
MTRSSTDKRPRPLRELGIVVGDLPTGPHNTIADVDGVLVGHATLVDGAIQTGVTAVLPHGGDLFREKVPAAAYVLNGFGKSVGLMQIDELGTVETPILLCNTFAVGACATALIRRAVAADPAIGREAGTVNPAVFECNDGHLNDLHAFAVGAAEVDAAIAAASAEFAQGAVGAGRGMSAFGHKGGIGSASRMVELDRRGFTVGALVLANFGRASDLTVASVPVGRHLSGRAGQVDRGSIIMVLATDVPLEHRQLRRVAKRAGVGLARTGSFLGNGSGDVAVAFSTAERVRHDEQRDLVPSARLNEGRIDRLFRAAAECVEEAILNALCCAGTVVGRDGHRRLGLFEDPAVRGLLDR